MSDQKDGEQQPTQTDQEELKRKLRGEEEPAEPETRAEKILGLFPKLDRDERQELAQRIEIGANGGVDFMVMMCLAATLASLGLLQGSGAVVIGAMLVAPLMGPLIGAGLALIQGNKEEERMGWHCSSIIF